MLDIKFVRQNPDLVRNALENRGKTGNLDFFLAAEEKRRELLTRIEDLRNQRNTASQTIARIMKQKGDASDLTGRMKEVSNEIKELEKELAPAEDAVRDALLGIPNIPHESVPVGRDERDNPVRRLWGTPRAFDFAPKAHDDVGRDLKILDLERAAKIAGARFPLFLGEGARLVRAIISLMLEIHTTRHGYREALPPLLVNRESMTGTGQLPKFEEDLFKLSGWDYYLIPTAEVPVTNIHRGEVLNEADLPLYYTAYTPCFRSEAGSYGKDTKGLIRQHQFDKVEMVKFCTPETSWDELEKLLSNAEAILKELELPYRVITLCTGDMGFSAAKTYDIEVWFPAQNCYREISSCSNFTDYQARRADIRFKRPGKKGTELVHTLNGSGLAVGRTFAAILENCQNEDGSVTIPAALRPYMGGKEAIAR